MLSIIIPVYNQHEITYECIQAVRECTNDFEIIIVDNGSEPAIELPFAGFHSIRVIRNEQNEGFPKAVNQGIRAAMGETIVLLNNDVIVTPKAMNILSNALEEFDVVGPLTNYAAGVQRVTAPYYGAKQGLYDIAEDWSEDHAGEFIETNWIIGFCMAFKKFLYDEIGSFDESLWPCSGEEIDWCLRAKKAGYRVGVACDVYVHHEGSQTFMDMQSRGLLDYDAICERDTKHLEAKWGSFWNNQLIEGGIYGEAA